MKRCLRKVVSLLVAVVVIASMSVCAFASDVHQDEGFTPDCDSTWGDLYRHFDPEGFETLPIEIQEQYDSVLLDVDTTANSVMVASEEDETTVSTSGCLYKDDSDVIAARDLDIAGLLNLTLGVSSTKTKIEYTAGFFSTISCPWMYCSVSIYDADTGKFMDLDSSSEEDAKVCSVDGSFTDLESKHTYTVKALGLVTPPAGYVSSGPLSVQTDKKTK